MAFKDYLYLIRVRQWYKNIVIFLAIFFSGNLVHLKPIYLTFLGFISLCLLSSAGYIINDFKDLKKDRLHPEKKMRPLASRKIKTWKAISLLSVFLLISFLIADLLLPPFFLYALVILLLLNLAYTFFLKNIIFADILTIASLFVIRAISGTYIIKVDISPWLILCPFFLSIFLSIGKRHSDLQFLKTKAAQTRKVLKEYNPQITNSLMLISTTLLIISYALYSFLSEHNHLLYTLPFALFVIFRYFYLIYSDSIIARHPEKIIKDKQMIIGLLLWIIITALLIY